MSGRYATQTAVSVERSKGEIERILTRYGAEEFAYGTTSTMAMIGFKAHGRYIKFTLPLPNLADFRMTPGGRRTRSATDQERAWEQACRSAWRSLALAVKAKLEAVDAGIVTFEDEFLAYMVLPDGQTVGAHIAPAIEEAYSTGKVQPLLALPERK